MRKNISYVFISLTILTLSLCCSHKKSEEKSQNILSSKESDHLILKKKKKDYLQKPFKVIDLWGNSIFDFEHSRSAIYTKDTSFGDIINWIPNMPVFHNYNTDPNPLRYKLNMKLGNVFFSSLPSKIQDVLQKENILQDRDLSIFLSFQNYEKEDNGHTCFRPHYFFDQNIPDSFSGTRYSKNIKAGVFNLSDGSLQATSDQSKSLLQDNMKAFQISIHDDKVSPNNLWIQFPEIDILSFFSVVIGPSFNEDSVQKAAVTLHFYLGIGSEVNALDDVFKNKPKNFLDLYNEMAQDATLAKSKAFKQLALFLSID